MKFLIDAGVGKKVEEVLLAVSEGRMIITMDKDFGKLVYNSEILHSGVLIPKLEDSSGKDKAHFDFRGCFLCYEP